MNVLIVYAHPEPSSFTGALKDAAVRALATAGHHVEVSDLYAEGFNPVAGRHDFTGAADPARFHYQSEQLHASQTGSFAVDLVREQERLRRADLLVLIFPLWWGGLPAIVKGWFDRVCAYGMAYADGRRFARGYFVGRRALLGLTTGGTIERFSEGGSYGDMKDVLYSVRRCILEYLGLEVMEPFVAYAAPRVEAGRTGRIPAQLGGTPARDGGRSGLARALERARRCCRPEPDGQRGESLGGAAVGIRIRARSIRATH
jgi:NAD(P)H dehydrogenase (quinone)